MSSLAVMTIQHADVCICLFDVSLSSNSYVLHKVSYYDFLIQTKNRITSFLKLSQKLGKNGPRVNFISSGDPLPPFSIQETNSLTLQLHKSSF